MHIFKKWLIVVLVCGVLVSSQATKGSPSMGPDEAAVVRLKVTTIAALDYHALALKSDGTVWAWGRNKHGQLGDGTNRDRYIPVQVNGIADVVDIAGGNTHSLALKTDGTVWAWGKNVRGQLGDGTSINRNTPVQVKQISGIVAIAGGGHHSLALKKDGTIWAWGRNTKGQLGDETTRDTNIPVQVKGISGVTAIDGRAAYSIALKGDGTVWAWGHNRSIPEKITELSRVKAISAGYNHSLALRKNGTVWAWGKKAGIWLGTGESKNREIPARVKILSGVVAISGGHSHSLALKDDGTLWAWGKNNNGQLGDGTTINKNIPVQVIPNSGLITISAGNSYSLALKKNGRVLAWGKNKKGQLGDGTRIKRLRPVRVKIKDTILLPPTVQIEANPGSIKAGESSTLFWSSTNADSCTIEPGIGTVEITGSVTVSPTEDTTYTITATGAGGTVTANVPVVVYPLPTANIQADPPTIEAGQSATLSWTATGADTCTIEPGIGTVNLTGTTTISPTENTVYTLTVSGPGGAAAASTTLTVTPPNHPPTVSITGLPVKGNAPLPVSFTAFPSDPDNDNLVLTWDFGDGTVLEGEAVQTHTYRSEGDFFAVVTASDGKLQARATLQVTVEKEPVIPPEPADVAPELDRTVTTTVQRATEFLYTGENPIQTGVAPGTIEVRRAAVLRGKVLDREGNAVPGVHVTVLEHPEFGRTLTRADGMFDMAVNGGSMVTLNYEKSGSLPVQRQVKVPWQDYIHAPDIVMIGVDKKVTPVKMNAAAEVQAARATPVTDESGTRQATTLFPENTAAEIVLPDGTTQALETLHLRATEYTVGDKGPEAMPAELPPQTAYTYCFELSADEAVAASADTVTFSKPVIQYVENFLGFPIGENVPLGYYDRKKGAWVSSDNGRVIKILSVTGGLADLDIDGSGNPADPAALEQLGVTAAERTKLASLYPVGQGLWRMPIPHFSPWDANWGYGPPPNATTPGQPKAPNNQQTGNSCATNKCIIDYQNQVVGESVDIVGTPFTLNYRSSRVPGYVTSRTVDIPLVKSSYPASLMGVRLFIETAGRRFSWGFAPKPNLRHTFTWDGKDSYGRYVQGQSPMTIRIAYDYEGEYTPVPRFGYSGNGNIITGNRTRRSVTLWQIYDSDETYTAKLTYLDSRARGLGGWDLDIHHSYDPVGKMLYLGNGEQRSAENVNAVIETVAGIGGSCGIGNPCGDGGPAVEARLYNPTDVLAAPDGSLYISEGYNRSCIRKVDPDGTITTIAGYRAGFTGDGGPASQAWLNGPGGLELGPDGSLYISDTRNHRVRRIDPQGIITTIAGTGTAGSGGDGGPALEAQLYYPNKVALGPDGSLYIAVGRKVRRVAPDGTIDTVAGNGASCSDSRRADCLNDGPAVGRPIGDVTDIAVDQEGNLYIANTLGGFHGRLRKVGPDGIIRTVTGFDSIHSVALGPDGAVYMGRGQFHPLYVRLAPDGTLTKMAGLETGGNYVMGFSGDGGPAGQAKFCGGSSQISIGPDGSLYIVDGNYYNGYLQCANNRIRRVAPHLPGVCADNFSVPSEDGSELYDFTAEGRHLRTVNALTGTVLYTFAYDNSGRLAAVTDGDNNVTTIERDADGKPTAVVGPYGQRTILSQDENGWLARVTNPAGEGRAFTYTGGGLLLSEQDERAHEHTYAYDERGLLTRFESPDGRVETLARVKNGNVSEVTVTPSEGSPVHYKVEAVPGGDRMHANTFADGSSATVQYRGDGGHGVTYSNGNSASQAKAPDPRWGMTAPVVKSHTTRTPGGLSFTTAATRSVSLANPGDPLSLTAQTDTLAINGQRYTRFYDAASRLFTLTTAEGRRGTTTIDKLGRIINAQWADFEPSVYTYDSRGRLTGIAIGTGTGARTLSFDFNAGGYIETVTDPFGQTLDFAYDGAGRITRETLPGNRITAYGYDAAGNLTSITPPGRPAHIFEYNAGGLVSKYTPPDVGAGVNFTTYAYDTKQRPTLITRPDNKTLSFTYDGAGRLAAMTLPTGQVAYTYDTPGCGCQGTGLPSEIATPDTTLKFEYDGTILTGQSWSGPVTGSVSRSYDNNFRIVKQTVNGTAAIDYTYDNDGLPTKAGDLEITLNTQNGLIAGTALGTVTDTWEYDDFGEPVNYNVSTNGTVIYTVQYSRDKLGRVTRKTETLDGTTTTYDYSYDNAGRLTEVKTNGAVTSGYQYDLNGNRTVFTGAGNTVSGTYDNQDRLTQYGDTTYTYTANGELETKTVGGQASAYEYDVLGNLRRVDLPDGTGIDYVIDGQSRRIGKKINGTLVRGFLYQGLLNPIAQLDGGGNIEAVFVYACRSNVPDYMVKDTGTYRIISDHLGSPRLVVNTADGEIVQRMDYNEFGIVIADTNPGFQPFGFAGGVYDNHTKLVRFGVRDYNPGTGRWTAKDSLLFAGGESNLYVYAMNDPVNFIDPYGYELSDALDWGWNKFKKNLPGLTKSGTAALLKGPLNKLNQKPNVNINTPSQAANMIGKAVQVCIFPPKSQNNANSFPRSPSFSVNQTNNSNSGKQNKKFKFNVSGGYDKKKRTWNVGFGVDFRFTGLSEIE